MIYISLLLDAVSVILGIIIINLYINSKGSADLKEDNLEPVAANNETQDIDTEEIIYAPPPEDDSNIVEEVIGEDNKEIVIEEKLSDSTVTITNDAENILPHSTFYDKEIIEMPVEIQMSRRRRLALKLTEMNKEE